MWKAAHRPRRARFGRIVTVALCLLLLVGGAIYYALTRPHYVVFTASNPPLSLRYNSKLEQVPLTKADEQDKFLLRLKNSPQVKEDLLVTVRYEDGLQPLATATKRNLRDMLLENASKVHPNRFPDYKELSRRSFSQDNHDAGEVVFTYTGPSKQIIQQRFIILVQGSDLAVYVSVQAPKASFEHINDIYFQHLIDSLTMTL